MDNLMLPLSSLFDDDDDHDHGKVGSPKDNLLYIRLRVIDNCPSVTAKEVGADNIYEEKTHPFPGGTDICVREFSFHQLNANLLWPGTFQFSEWLLQNHSILEGRRILELGSGTGALAIFVRKQFGVEITTSDFDDGEIEENIAHNCRTNGLEILPHIRHTWGEIFPVKYPDWDLIIANDILLYVKQYPNLIKTLCFLLKPAKHEDRLQVKNRVSISGKDMQLRYPMFLMSWRRRIGKEEEKLFFRGCEDAGLFVEHLGSRIYLINY